LVQPTALFFVQIRILATENQLVMYVSNNRVDERLIIVRPLNGKHLLFNKRCDVDFYIYIGTSLLERRHILLRSRLAACFILSDYARHK
jgi:hypothetical protein